jgi:hypothetical protein
MRRSTSASALNEKKTQTKINMLFPIHKSTSSQMLQALPNAIADMVENTNIVPWHIEDLETTIPFVPMQQAIICGSTHSFPLSLLDPEDNHDARSLATCLATPSVKETEERVEPSNILRRIVNLDVVYRRRMLMHKLLSQKLKRNENNNV